MSKKIELSACLIARDSEEDIAWCLEGLKGEVDEIVVVDTGSQDATKSIARRYTKRVYSFAWCDDFAAAKNFALSKARGQWVFFVDSDERLTDDSRGGRLRAAIHEGAKLGADLLSIVRHEVDTKGNPVGMPDNLAVRVLRHVRGLRFHDPIHEYLAFDDGREAKPADVTADVVALWHRGYSPERMKAKYERNVRLLEKAEQEGRPKLNLHYYLSGLYYYADRWQDVCREAELSLEAGESPATGALELWRNYETALEKLGDEKGLKALLARAVREVPELPDTYVRLAVFSMMEGDFAQGKTWLLEAKKREAAFPQACPHDYDLFRQALPQVEKLLAQCNEELGEEPEGTEDTKNTEESKQQDAVEKRKGEDVKKAKKQAPAAQEDTEQQAPAAQEGTAKREPTVNGEWIPKAQSLADTLPTAAKLVVVFGCGRGEEGAKYLRRHPGGRCYGVCASRADVAAARQALTGAVCGTAESVDLSDYGLADVECMVFSQEAAAAVSQEALVRQAAALSEDGQMVLLLAQDGPRKHEALLPMLQAAGLGHFSIVPDDVGGQMVVRALKKKDVPNIGVQTLLGETIVTARLRVELPGLCLASTPGFFVHHSRTTVNGVFARQMDANILVRQRRGYHSVDDGLEKLGRLRKQGFLVIYEMDDSPTLWAGKSEALRYLEYAGAHAIQVSTPELAKYMKQYNPHVFVFPNELWELPEERDYEAEARERDGRVTIFFGALNRERDWQDILPVLNRVAAAYKGKVFFRVLADRLFYDALKTEDKEFVAERGIYGGKFVPYDVYEKALHTADINLLPLHDTEFNRSKSDLKFIESAGHGAVPLASPVVYRDSILDGCTGVLYRDAEMFEARLKMLIEQPERRRAIARSAYAYVREHRMMSQHYMERVQAYRWLVEHKAELDRELDERLAKLHAKLGLAQQKKG